MPKSPLDIALEAEGITGDIANIARSIYQQESGSGKNTKTSNAGARGGMQIIPATFQRMADKGWNINDAEQNARAGVRYIKTLYDKAGGDPALTAAGYYGGEGAISKAKKGIAVSDPRNPKAPNTLQYGAQVAARLPKGEDLNALWEQAAPVEQSAQSEDLNALWEQATPVKQPAKSGGFLSNLSIKNVPENAKKIAGGMAGVVSGIADVGQTISYPVNAIADLVKGQDIGTQQADMKAKYSKLFADNVDTNSVGYQGGKIAGNIIGTLPVGGAIGSQVSKLAPKLGSAISSGGLTLNAPKASNVAGKLGQMLTRTTGGAINGGASAGLIDPNSALLGAGVGGALPAGVKALGGAGSLLSNSAKSIIEPFYAKGQDAIIGRVLQQATGGKVDDVIANLNTPSAVQGFSPTVAQQSGDAGLAALSNAASSVSPRAKDELFRRNTQNNDTIVEFLQKLIPDKQAAISARESAVKPIYDGVKNSPVNMTPELDTLFQRPSMESALSRAKNLALENGNQLAPDALNGQGAQYIKMSLDDMSNSSPLTGVGGNELRAIQGTRGDFISELEKQIPEYLQANKIYADMSKPINQSDVLSEILSKALNEHSVITPSRGMRAIDDKVAQKVLGRDNATLANTLDAPQMQGLDSLKTVLSQMNFANNAGKSMGSNTVQNAAYANILNQFGVPNALRNTSAGGVIGGVLSKAGDVAYRKANEQIAERMALSLLDPKTAAQLMQGAQPTSSRAMEYLPPLVKSLPALVNSNRQ